MRNIARINNYYNNIEAQKDWMRLANTVIFAGHGELVEKHRPPEHAGWRKIDKAIVALRAEYQVVSAATAQADGRDAEKGSTK